MAEIAHGYTEDSRGLGLLDMVHAIAEGRPARASGELAYHICEVMEGIAAAPKAGGFVEIESRPEKPTPLPVTSPNSPAYTKGVPA